MHDSHYVHEHTWASAPIDLCSGCDGTTMIRADTGLCERCSAKLPEAIRAWQQSRERSKHAARTISIIPRCWVCDTVLPAGVTEWKHKLSCPARPMPCDHCSRRFDTAKDKRLHEDKWHRAA